MDRMGDYFKCFDRRFLAWTLVGVGVLFAATYTTFAFPRGSVGRLLCAAVQAASVGTLIVTSVLRMRHLDELQRRIQLESIAIAFAIGTATITGWSFFEHAGAPHFDWAGWVWPFFSVTWVAALFMTRRRYR
jgi:hypothetical protein